MENQSKLRRYLLMALIIVIGLAIIWKLNPNGGGGAAAQPPTPVSDIQLPNTTVAAIEDSPTDSPIASPTDYPAETPPETSATTFGSTEIPSSTSTPTQILIPTSINALLVPARDILAGSGVTYSRLLGYRVDISSSHVTQYLNNYALAYFLETELLSNAADEDPLDGAIIDALIHNYVTYKPEEAYDFELDGHVGKRFDFYDRDVVGDYIYRGSVIAFQINDQQAFVISGYGFMRFGKDIWEEIGLPNFDALLSGIDFP